MKFAIKSSALNSFVLAGLLATVGASAMAQGAPAAPPAGPAAAGKPAGPPGDRMGRHDPAKMQAFVAKRQADMKAKLKITPAQEGAWTAYTASMQPPAHGVRPTPEQRAEFGSSGSRHRRITDGECRRRSHTVGKAAGEVLMERLDGQILALAGREAAGGRRRKGCGVDGGLHTRAHVVGAHQIGRRAQRQQDRDDGQAEHDADVAGGIAHKVRRLPNDPGTVHGESAPEKLFHSGTAS